MLAQSTSPFFFEKFPIKSKARYGNLLDQKNPFIQNEKKGSHGVKYSQPPLSQPPLIPQ